MMNYTSDYYRAAAATASEQTVVIVIYEKKAISFQINEEKKHQLIDLLYSSMSWQLKLNGERERDREKRVM